MTPEAERLFLRLHEAGRLAIHRSDWPLGDELVDAGLATLSAPKGATGTYAELELISEEAPEPENDMEGIAAAFEGEAEAQREQHRDRYRRRGR